MKDYKKYINALRKCAKEHDNDRTFTGNIIVSDLCRDTANLLEEVEQKQKSGKWILTDDDFVYCSECEDSYYPRPIDASWYYCPHCGARMESEDKE